MKIVVTGGLGFIGSHLVDHYVDLGHEVVVLDNLSTGTLKNVNPRARLVIMSLLDERLEDWICSEKPDLINHQAAHVNVRASVAEPIYDAETNVLGTVRLLLAAGSAQVSKIIFASSGGTVYGLTPNISIPETYHGTPVSPYGINKLACEHYIQFYAKHYGFQWVILRYANVYGFRQNPHGESGVISIFLDRLRNGMTPTVYGDGEQVRDYVHVRDVVAANMLFSAADSAANEIYNVGTARATSLNELIRLLLRWFPDAKSPKYEEAKSGDLPWNVLSVEKLLALGWNPTISLEEGLEQLCSSR